MNFFKTFSFKPLFNLPKVQRTFHSQRDMLRGELNALHRIDNKFGQIFYNTSYETTKEHMRAYNESIVLANGVHTIYTGKFTGRSPKDKYFVYNDSSESSKLIDWGSVNQKMQPEVFGELYDQVAEYLGKRERLYVYDGQIAKDYGSFKSKKIRVITPYAYQHHFIKNMVIPADPEDKRPIDFTILNAPEVVNKKFKEHGLNSETFVAFNIEKKTAIIGNTSYTGENKKGLFSMMNYWGPLEGHLTLHSSAIKYKENTILMCGLSGTGKSSQSSHPLFDMIGDDEHIFTKDNNIINIECGLYYKCLNLNEKDEEMVYKSIKNNSLLENIGIKKNEKGELIPDFTDSTFTQNTRVSIPIDYIESYSKTNGFGDAPKSIIFLTCDSYGVLPMVSKLTPDQTKQHFLVGYTSSMPSVEKSEGENAIKPVFSSCYGRVFLPLKPEIYGNMLMDKVNQLGISIYLVNTGFYGGQPNKNGKRAIFDNTRYIIQSIADGSIEKCEFVVDEFGYKIPKQIGHIGSDYLLPWNHWQNKDEFKKESTKLNNMILDQYNKVVSGNA
jgi:phosphoenolpyruvate carboxykinase (ATP)